MLNNTRIALVNLAFLWLGIFVTYSTLDGLTRDAWPAATVKLILWLSIAVVLVEVVSRVAAGRMSSNGGSATGGRKPE